MTKNDLIAWVPDDPKEAAANWRQCRKRIHDAFEVATSGEQRAELLALNYSIMNLAEKAIAPKDLENFREVRGHSYAVLVVSECLKGDTVCATTAANVIRREVAAGRMAPDHALRNLVEMAKFAAQIVRTRQLTEQYSPRPKGLKGWAMSLLTR
jgi:hypothetical protein